MVRKAKGGLSEKKCITSLKKNKKGGTSYGATQVRRGLGNYSIGTEYEESKNRKADTQKVDPFE